MSIVEKEWRVYRDQITNGPQSISREELDTIEVAYWAGVVGLLTALGRALERVPPDPLDALDAGNAFIRDVVEECHVYLLTKRDYYSGAIRALRSTVQ